MESIIFGRPNRKPLIVKNYMAIFPEVLVCKECHQPVYPGWGEHYTCETCHALPSYVEWKKSELTA